MSGGQMMVVLIVAIVMIAQIVKSRHGHRRGTLEGDDEARAPGENARLREALKQLKARLAVLERITVEKENTLERQIEELRDR